MTGVAEQLLSNPGGVAAHPLEETLNSYQGPVRILGDDGVLLTTGSATLEADPEHGNWIGLLHTLPHTGVAGKALLVTLESPDATLGRAQLIPESDVGDHAVSRVVGLGADAP